MRLRTEDVAKQTIDGETIVLDLHNSQYLSVNAAGSYLLGLLDHDQTEQDLSERLAAEFEITPDVAARDVATFVQRLRDLSLIVDRV